MYGAIPTFFKVENANQLFESNYHVPMLISNATVARAKRPN